jgi:hypothetical protein
MLPLGPAQAFGLGSEAEQKCLKTCGCGERGKAGEHLGDFEIGQDERRRVPGDHDRRGGHHVRQETLTDSGMYRGAEAWLAGPRGQGRIGCSWRGDNANRMSRRATSAVTAWRRSSIPWCLQGRLPRPSLLSYLSSPTCLS